MYRERVILCVIPARARSKRLPHKNIKKFAGKPLIAHTIQQARKSRYIDKIIVSTENAKIAGIAAKYGAGAPFIRPRKLASDGADALDVLRHAMTWMEKKGGFRFDILVLLQVTSPLRTSADIDRCIELLVSENLPNVFSVTDIDRNTFLNTVRIDKGRIQEHRKRKYQRKTRWVYALNGAVYVWQKDVLYRERDVILDKSGIYFMPKERSFDIDDPYDFKMAELWFAKKEASK